MSMQTLSRILVGSRRIDAAGIQAALLPIAVMAASRWISSRIARTWTICARPTVTSAGLPDDAGYAQTDGRQSHDQAGYRRLQPKRRHRGRAETRARQTARDDGKGWMEGWAERIEYDNRTDKFIFFDQARIKTSTDDAQGDVIIYDNVTERYQITGQGTTDSGPEQSAPRPNRVQPRTNQRNASISPPPARCPSRPAAHQR